MNEKKSNWPALSIVCVVQTALCGAVLLGILLFKLAGGGAYEQAEGWYREAVSDTVLVYSEQPDVSSAPEAGE